jgi:hypothetical protein
VLLGFGGLHLIWTAWFQDEPQARVALSISAVFCAMLACAWTVVASRGHGAAIVESILFGTLAGKDLLQVLDAPKLVFEGIVDSLVPKADGPTLRHPRGE